MRRHVTTLLVALNVGLAVLLAALWLTPQGGLRNAAWQPPAPVKPEFASAVAVNAPTDPAGLMASVDRPLFSPSRLPPPVKAAGAPEPPPDPLANIRLHGIYAGQGVGGIIATVDGKSRRFRLNESVGEWKVASIKDRDVTFTRGGETRVIRLAMGAGGLRSGAVAAGGARSAAGPAGSGGGLLAEARRAAEQENARLAELLNRGRAPLKKP